MWTPVHWAKHTSFLLKAVAQQQQMLVITLRKQYDSIDRSRIDLLLILCFMPGRNKVKYDSPEE